MVLLSIGFASGKCDIYNKLNELTLYFKEKGVSIGLVECDSNDMHFIKCVIKDEDSNEYNIPEIKKSFNMYASDILYQIIVDNFQKDIIFKIINSNYDYFKNEETNEIASRCIGILKGAVSSSSEDYSYYLNRKDKVAKKIFEYVCESTDIIIEGFLRFRLKEYNSELEDLVDKVVEEYLVEKEYNEFIKLLKYFVEIQESRIEIVNIVIGMDGNYYMYDNKCNEITEEFLKEMINEDMSGDTNCDDLLVSSLITAAPRYIIIHNLSNVKNKEIIETIKSVFSERVKVCQGCSLCISKSPAHKI